MAQFSSFRIYLCCMSVYFLYACTFKMDTTYLYMYVYVHTLYMILDTSIYMYMYRYVVLILNVHAYNNIIRPTSNEHGYCEFCGIMKL